VSGAARGSVLVADDHRLIARLLRRSFEEAGHEVTVEMAGDRVAAAAARERPDLVVVDAHMKPVERFHALRSIVEELGADRPAIIVLSGNDEPAVRERALELGADAFVLKPWEEDELLELAQRLISKRGRR
jgi:two-component system, sensor histidine kinase